MPHSDVGLMSSTLGAGHSFEVFGNQGLGASDVRRVPGLAVEQAVSGCLAEVMRYVGQRAQRAERVAHSRGIRQAVVALSSVLVSHGTHPGLPSNSSACRARKSMRK
jgi:hypothetical protein